MSELSEVIRKTKLFEFDNLSNKELENIIMKNGRILLGTNDPIEAQKLNGEILACNDIMEQRKNYITKHEQTKKDWAKQHEKKREKILLKLKYAVTANGQLIAAILEDEKSLTAEEIAGWCDELASLPDEDMKELLTGLVKEGVLSEKDGRYSLRQICTETLMPENAETWILDKAAEINLSKDYILAANAAMKYNIRTLNCYAISPMDLYNGMRLTKGNRGAFIPRSINIDWAEYNPIQYNLQSDLENLEIKYILSIWDYDFYFYSIPMLGDDPDEKEGDDE